MGERYSGDWASAGDVAARELSAAAGRLAAARVTHIYGWSSPTSRPTVSVICASASVRPSDDGDFTLRSHSVTT
ncbi:hypothetical protein ABTX62_22545 [Streptomyces sp. NPDC096046]|uniref:hypothetical protein n=1 Tax=Streptomyces sp. NPDC096046 TaxID=3155542 RepID=UPI003319FEE9